MVSLRSRSAPTLGDKKNHRNKDTDDWKDMKRRHKEHGKGFLLLIFTVCLTLGLLVKVRMDNDMEARESSLRALRRGFNKGGRKQKAQAMKQPRLAEQSATGGSSTVGALETTINADKKVTRKEHKKQTEKKKEKKVGIVGGLAIATKEKMKDGKNKDKKKKESSTTTTTTTTTTAKLNNDKKKTTRNELARADKKGETTQVARKEMASPAKVENVPPVKKDGTKKAVAKEHKMMDAKKLERQKKREGKKASLVGALVTTAKEKNANKKVERAKKKDEKKMTMSKSKFEHEKKKRKMSNNNSNNSKTK